ncbi:MAG: hypothetical protein F6K22_18370 [Okeania sp. SIO2F4]|uniref:hypothetical protein n=1 Tax=Okeania sp. SIO2F4 TaxID=2607790 RepID=UPI00142A5727|nr:hypothetical protein [Okeania sp. SIO2F4]NES04621.1 hypothetical protein [Okeania sp. SIO2F4]
MLLASVIDLFNYKLNLIVHNIMLSKIKKALPVVLLSASIPLTFTLPAKAQLSVDAEIAKITAVAASLEGVVAGFTTILVGSGGISAAFQIFRRIILQNV